MKRFWAFFFGIIFGWVLLFGGIAVAAYTVSLSTFNVKLEFVDKDGKRLDEMSLADIIIKGVQLGTNGTLSFQTIEDTYGIDLLGQMGLKGEAYAQLKSTTINQITADPAGALACVALSDFFGSDIGKNVYTFPDSILTAWGTNNASVGDLIQGDFAKVLSGVTLKDFLTNLTTDGVTGIIATKDLGGLIDAFNAEGGDPVKYLLDDMHIGDLMSYTYDEETEEWSKNGASLSELEKTLAKISIDELMAGGFNIDSIFGDLKVGELMGYTLEDETWYSGTGGSKKQVGKLMATFANVSVSSMTNGTFDVMNTIGTLKIGELLDYTFNTTENKWYNGTTPISDSVMNNVYSTVIDDMDTVSLNSIVGYIGEVMNFCRKQIANVEGYAAIADGSNVFSNGTLYAIKDGDKYYEAKISCTQSHAHTDDCFENIWYKDNTCTSLVGVLESKLADIKASELTTNFGVDTILKGLRLGDIMGYTFENDKWFSGEGASKTQVDRVTEKIADMTYDQLKNGLNIGTIFGDLYVGELLGYELIETADGSEKWHSGNGGSQTAVNSITQNLCALMVSDLTGGNINMDKLLDNVVLSDIITISPTAPVILRKLADKPVLNISDNISDIYIGDLQEYVRKGVSNDGYTQLAANSKVYVNGNLYLIQEGDTYYEARLDCSETHTHTENCFEFVWYEDSLYQKEITGVQQLLVNMTVANVKIDDIVSKINNLKFTDVITGVDTTKGAFMLIGADTTIGDLPNALSNAVETGSIRKLMDAGLLNITPSNLTTLNRIYGTADANNNGIIDWQEMSIGNLINELINRVPVL